jgi:hypothetical protein
MSGLLCVLVLLCVFLQRRSSPNPKTDGAALGATNVHVADASTQSLTSSFRRRASGTVAEAELPPGQIVSNKVAKFSRSRREIAHTLARRANIEVPPEVDRYFEAIENGRWEEAKALFDIWMKERRDPERKGPPTVAHDIWPAISETHGVAETAHNWRPEKLLEYGEKVLGALRPGMVYVGGTDPGRYIPTLLNETSEGEHHVVLTQNALADGTYLKYLDFLHGDQLQALNEEDSQKAFADYMRGAQERLEKNQLRPGEDVRRTENRLQVSGQVAVMSINEGLLSMLMEKNPSLSFALEESFPLKSTYEGALPLGPLLELRASKEPPNRELVSSSVEQWRTMSHTVGSDAPNSEVRKTYSHMAQAQGNYFSDQGFTAEAEQTWRLAREMCPANPEAVGSLYRLWKSDGRANEAESMLNTFARDYPEQSSSVESIRKHGGSVIIIR